MAGAAFFAVIGGVGVDVHLATVDGVEESAFKTALFEMGGYGFAAFGFFFEGNDKGWDCHF